MLTNCPNCGAPLTKDGWCDYCKTKVRLANLMVIDHDVELVNMIQNRLMSRFENLNGSDGILVEYVRDEILDVCDDFMNELAK